MDSSDASLATQLSKKISEFRRSIDDIEECRGTQERPLHQFFGLPISNVLFSLRDPFGRWNSGIGPDISRSQYHSYDTLILCLSFILANGVCTCAVTCENDPLKPELLCKVDPCCYVSYLFAGDSPICATADSLSSWPGLVIAKIVHPRVTGDEGVAAFCQVSADCKIRRIIEVEARSVNPNHSEWFMDVFGRRKNRPQIGHVIVSLNLDDSFRDLSRFLTSGLRFDASDN